MGARDSQIGLFGCGWTDPFGCLGNTPDSTWNSSSLAVRHLTIGCGACTVGFGTGRSSGDGVVASFRAGYDQERSRDAADCRLKTGHSENAKTKNMIMFTTGAMAMRIHQPLYPAFVKIFTDATIVRISKAK